MARKHNKRKCAFCKHNPEQNDDCPARKMMKRDLAIPFDIMMIELGDEVKAGVL
jgi:hypothetical protein